MENSANHQEQDNLVNELTQGRDLAKQLQNHLNLASSSSHEAREVLVQKILSSYDKALSMLKWNGSAGEPPLPAAGAIVMAESPPSLSGSPHSDDSDPSFKDHEQRDGSKKRKSMPRWKQQVQVCPGTGLEGPLDDGQSWRKYGQKDILGAKYPRGYYRCTQRFAQGCLATKQVQRSDEDPTIFEITYRGRHTCNQGPRPHPGSSLSSSPSSPSPENRQANMALQSHLQVNPPKVSQETLLNFRTGGLRVITEGLETHHQSQPFPPFFLPSPSTAADNSFPARLSPSFMASPVSGSTFFPTDFGEIRALQSAECELAGIASTAASATSSPTVGLDFPFGPIDEFEPSFSFDNPGFFS
ncbi:probable WRKY transcription factor 53 [Diospyros lotus]|uniref:probable WRKY transcription factor 53 n=1 Tax=Diospyros lotus TaxID=55363 RepID=UPI002259FD88|nr:probable WRKY transcription factor 53 [Diospyros lotus]